MYYKNIDGLFEIHISVKPEDIALMKLFCFKNNYKCIMASSLYGDNKNQLMLSKWKNGKSIDCLEKAKKIEKDLSDFGISVVRTKIESIISNQNVPHDENNDFDASHYFEFHLKTICNSYDLWNKINDLTLIYKNKNNLKCNTSFNVFNQNIKILITLRIPANYGKIKAEFYKDNLINFYKSNNIHFNDEIQKEFCIYDTNPNYDDNWL
jgi:hypothetical protein